MAEPTARAGKIKRKRRKPARALLLLGAIVTIVLSGLFMAGTANAAPVTTAASAASTAHSAVAGPAARAAGNQVTSSTSPAAPGSICNLPGIGDIGGLVGLCNAGSGIVGDVNNICTSSAPMPEVATSGIDSMVTTPGGQKTGNTLYDNYGISGQYWASTGLTCSQMTSSIGNNVAGMVFDMAKSLDRVTITVYQSAAGSNILGWLSNSVDTLIKALGAAIYFPFLAPVVIIGAIWLAWQGLIRKRATRTFEGTIWMVVACAAAIWLIGQPNDFTSVGTNVSNGVTEVLNTAFAKLPATTGSNCLPVGSTDPQSVPANYSFTSGSGLVDQNANELWSVLVCEPWLNGELGTTQYVANVNSPAAKTNLVNEYGRQLLFAQAFAANEPVTQTGVNAKQSVYNGIAQNLKANDPAVYSLFQGDQWTTRLEIGFEALFAAVVAGLLILLIALTLIMMKLGFLLLLVAGPFFLIIGIHPGFGRVVAIRWFELLVGVLLKQVAIALTLSVLLYCYSLIMGTSALSWALKIMMIALVTVTVFIYRRPFQHLFSSVGYGMLGADERARVTWRESTAGFRRTTGAAGGVLVPGIGGMRASRWARRGADGGGGDGGSADSGAVPATGAAVPEGVTGGAPVADSHTTARQWPDVRAGGPGGRSAPPLPLSSQGGPPASGPAAGWARNGAAGAGTGRSAQPPVRVTGPQPAAKPPVGNSWPSGGAATRSGGSNGSGGGAAKPPAAPFWARSRRPSR